MDMDRDLYLFPDGMHVWLQSYAREGLYLYAHPDGASVFLRDGRASLRAAWQVHLLRSAPHGRLLLRSAAFGRYLALRPDPAPPGQAGLRAAQADFGEASEEFFARWTAEETELPDHDVVLLRNHAGGNLRANGRYLNWLDGVTVDGGLLSTMMYWRVHHIPPREAPPPLPIPLPDLFGPLEAFGRTIRFTYWDEQENFISMGLFTFYGRSVFNLRAEVAFLVNEPNFAAITMFVCAGINGRLTPLVFDLPLSHDRLDIVVVRTGSLVANMLRHPDVYAPAPLPLPPPPF